MQSAILMVPYVQRPFDFPRQIVTRKNEGFLSAVYSFFHLYQLLIFNLLLSTELQQLFSKLQAARLKQDFVTNEAFDRLRQKFKI